MFPLAGPRLPCNIKYGSFYFVAFHGPRHGVPRDGNILEVIYKGIYRGLYSESTPLSGSYTQALEKIKHAITKQKLPYKKHELSRNYSENGHRTIVHIAFEEELETTTLYCFPHTAYYVVWYGLSSDEITGKKGYIIQRT